jgi:hypothetical protein
VAIIFVLRMMSARRSRTFRKVRRKCPGRKALRHADHK